MSLIGSIGALSGSIFARTPGVAPASPGDLAGLPPAGGAIGTTPAAPATGFDEMLGGLVRSVDAKQQEAQALTRSVLLGQTDQLHQSVIAMQEASVSFQLMVEVRNKLVESYQELMRMPA
jgi:flagellar hook-basal body complex protein FliE